MKSTGIVRPVDSLGRIVLPIELRRILNINCKDPVEIFVDEDRIVLKKYQPSCIFCDSMDEIKVYKEKFIFGCLFAQLFYFKLNKLMNKIDCVIKFQTHKSS